jgi:hypothetical protein
VNTSDGVATFSGLSLQAVGTYQVAASAGAAPAVRTGSVTVSPGAAARVVLAGVAATATVKQSLPTVQVQVFDAFDNPVSNVTVSLAAAIGSLGGQSRATTDEGGVAHFTGVKFLKSGSNALLVSIAGDLLTVSSTIQVSNRPAALKFGAVPHNSHAGKPLAAVTVQLIDDEGLPLPQASVPVTLVLATANHSRHGARLLGRTTQFSGRTGMVMFTGLKITAPGTYRLTATARGVKTAVSVPFVVA